MNLRRIRNSLHLNTSLNFFRIKRQLFLNCATSIEHVGQSNGSKFDARAALFLDRRDKAGDLKCRWIDGDRNT
jgi:hypothetical protein